MYTLKESSEKQIQRVRKPLKRSSFVSQLQVQRTERLEQIRSSKRQLSFSTFIDLKPQQTRGNFHKSNQRLQHTEKMQQTQDEFRRARSARTAHFERPIIEVVQKNTVQELGESMVKLKIEQMVFKFKTKIGGLLKQLNVSSQQISKFGNLNRIQDILHFLSDRVRERLVNKQIQEANLHKVRSQEKITLSQYEVELQNLRKKLNQKQGAEKILKNKVRDSHNESRELLDKVNSKQKELSSKITELYQLKITLKQSQKTYSNLQRRYDILEKEATSYRQQLQTDSKDTININVQIQEENIHLKQKILQIEEQLSTFTQKFNTMTNTNKQLNQELQRWRERFEDQSRTQAQSSQENAPLTEVVTTPRSSMKKSTMSMSMSNFLGNNDKAYQSMHFSTTLQLENMKLMTKLEDLERKNRQLSRETLKHERFEQTLSNTGSDKADFSLGGKQKGGNVHQVQLETFYKKKLEDSALEWKEKLYDIVHKYQDELQLTKQKLDSFQLEKQQLEKKILDLANDKYQLQNKVISLEKQIFSLLKSFKSLGNNQRQTRESRSSYCSSQKDKNKDPGEVVKPMKTEGELKEIEGEINIQE